MDTNKNTQFQPPEIDKSRQFKLMWIAFGAVLLLVTGAIIIAVLYSDKTSAPPQSSSSANSKILGRSSN